MNKSVLFIQGGGEDGYEADKELVASLKIALADGYNIDYPELGSDESSPDFGWINQIDKQVSTIKDPDLILVGHSLGASMILKFLSENKLNKNIKAVFLIATPFWNGNEDWQKGLKLHENFANKLPNKLPVYFYHCRDDEVVPFSHFNLYKQKLSEASFREIKTSGHQLNNDLTLIAEDIKALNTNLKY